MEKEEHLYKILVIGNLGTGKTSIIKRYVHRFFPTHYKATIGVDFAMKVLNWNESTVLRLQFWDIEGQERFGNITRVYYRDAVGCFIVFDVTRPSTFDAVAKWKQDLDSKVQLQNGQPIPCLLLANKCDQPKEGLVRDASKMDSYCERNGFIGWYETSAKDNVNIDNATNFLVGEEVETSKHYLLIRGILAANALLGELDCEVMDSILENQRMNVFMSSNHDETSLHLAYHESSRSSNKRFGGCCS